ncbi:GntR family transcriptional regulator [Hydrogenophaga sp. YM1]|uniref:GntR family transcriptional regulator n=1 Tax=unclassified Hydrogenophaga TaxID=2610897 RepID=UPI00086B9516|nr:MULTISPECIES: GntR family transcriptional regulator [unclassified Hydrogenophaga]MBN9370927.1 GntR family transcriptional regulator [Hydrogenophaga sp.]ODT33068.1 MAG: GntR family transcriptional regulator [Hydrogenophaga sp. SCN 70-13]OJV35619.1 MAG: GntR family transcriptional regulator [Hydrogenophaga sp. 70-12]QRR36279.1 GntR family transcriptional regulator [Hydrogenophaga sp. YM1]
MSKATAKKTPGTPSTPRATAKKASGKAAPPADASAPAARPRSLTTQAYERIEALIVQLELLPGTALSEAELSARLGIGRTPVREALQRLAREHLVQILPQRGVLVSALDIKRQLRLLETRREVERLVARCAARRATDQERQQFAELAKEFNAAAKAKDQTRFMRADKAFNDLSLRAARNEFASGAMGLMHGLSRRFWFMHHRQADDTQPIAVLHARISQAIADGDETLAAKALDELIDHNEAFTRSTVNTDF